MSTVKIQMKVYDADGKRVAVAEALLPEGVTAADAAVWIEFECQKWARGVVPRDAKYDAQPEV